LTRPLLPYTLIPPYLTWQLDVQRLKLAVDDVQVSLSLPPSLRPPVLYSKCPPNHTHPHSRSLSSRVRTVERKDEDKITLSLPVRVDRLSVSVLTKDKETFKHLSHVQHTGLGTSLYIQDPFLANINLGRFVNRQSLRRLGAAFRSLLSATLSALQASRHIGGWGWKQQGQVEQRTHACGSCSLRVCLVCTHRHEVMVSD
jgi:hypothetical protein